MAERSIHVRLIKGYPVLAQVTEFMQNVPSESFEQTRGLRSQKATLVFKPHGVGEVMQADHRLNAAVVECLQHFLVPLNSSRIPSAFVRLNTAPLHGEAKGIYTDFASQVEIALRIRPPIASSTTTVSGFDSSRGLPGRPLIVMVATFDLVSCGGYSPQEICWEPQAGSGKLTKIEFAGLITFYRLYHRMCILKHLAIRLNVTGNSRGSRTLMLCHAPKIESTPPGR